MEPYRNKRFNIQAFEFKQYSDENANMMIIDNAIDVGLAEACRSVITVLHRHQQKLMVD